ncbi:MAG: hypothetical protein HOL80_03795 [Candidatus Magasanikbacteria bacterium]|jgi:hypothetical protein|nr:hypothetical protein [Candidatus Magasanikbacteria bacterium]MBT5262988.1 hypothetical protein [Candidatus Magasanikbacteria bacterium]MBT5820642.1 hypothetical protein [Candidatus Magasanikbacteria bacterium]MBT6294362.1 hypothetical protein [Candidatus Magasanikbacteria bacterium]
MKYAWEYIIGGGAAVISLASLLLIQFFPVHWVVWPVLIVWVGLFVGTYILTKKHLEWKEGVFTLALTTIVSTTGLLGVMSFTSLRILITCFAAVVLGCIYAFGVRAHISTWLGKKAFFRFMMIVWTFNCFAFLVLLFAFYTFFPGTFSFVLLMVLGSLIYGVCSMMVWRLYFDTHWQPLFSWALVIVCIMAQYIWVVHLLPFAYTLLACICTWLWYIIQLFVRFRLSKKHIIWKKQQHFLLGNGILFILFFIFFVRWV